MLVGSSITLSLSLGIIGLCTATHTPTGRLWRRDDFDQPVLTGNSTKAFKANNAKVNSYSQADTKAQVSELDSSKPWWSKQAVAVSVPATTATSATVTVSPTAGSTPATAVPQLIKAVAAADDIDPPTIPNRKPTVSADDSSVPAIIRPSNNNYQQQAALATLPYCYKAFGLNCGTNCAALPPGFTVLAQTGNGESDPLTLISIVPDQKLLVVAHQGSNFSSLPSILNDLLFLPFPLLPDLLPKPSLTNGALQLSTVGAAAHIGFQTSFQRLYPATLAAVKQALAGPAKGYTVLVTGHSLGAAIAELTGIALRNSLTTKDAATVRVSAFAAPRVGNEAFSNYATLLLGNNQVHFNRAYDPVPHLLPRITTGVALPNELFYTPANDLVYCPGRDNRLCLAGVKSANFDFFQHVGPFFGITMGSCKGVIPV